MRQCFVVLLLSLLAFMGSVSLQKAPLPKLEVQLNWRWWLVLLICLDLDLPGQKNHNERLSNQTGLWWVILMVLVEVGGPAHCAQRHSWAVL